MPLSIRSSLYRILLVSSLAVVIGASVSFLAMGFIELVEWLNHVLFITPHARIQVSSPVFLTSMTLLVPSLGGLIVGTLLYYGTAQRRPHGPPDVIATAQVQRPLPRFKSGCVSTLAACLSLGCGASVGQYGPIVYLGAMLGGLVNQLRLSLPNSQSIAMACGVAAAISVTFNAPIAGLVFAHEVILRHYSLQAFAPTTIASVTGYVVGNLIFERSPLFLVEFAGVQQGYEFMLFAFLGVLCALMAILFMHLIFKAAQLAQHIKIPAPFKPALAGLVLGITALWLPDILGVGKETLRFGTIEGAFTLNELMLLVLAKMLLTALCIGFGFAGGVFSPALLIGVLLGAWFWSVLHLLGITNSGVAVYAICAMMALTSPVIGAPLTTILIVFELTRNYDLTIAAMVSVVFANLIAYRFFGRSLFDIQLYKQGVDLHQGRDQAHLNSIKIHTFAHQNHPFASTHESASTALDRLALSGHSEMPITDKNNVYQGLLRIQDTRYKEDTPLIDLLCQDHLSFSEQTTLWQAIEKAENFQGEVIPVIQQKTGMLLGILTETDLMNAYIRHCNALRKEENESM